MTNGTEGGVLHLLRLTRTQCHAWVAFVALRSEDGTIDITAVPGPDDEGSEWTLETLEGIVRQTLEDPLIGEGRAVIRVSEVFRRYWPGERQYTRMAVAPLNDVSGPGRPWGLLCALDPVDGQFSEAQLDMLGRLAVRFLNHLRVRRQFVDDAAASEALLAAAMPQEVQAPAPAEPGRPSDEVPASHPDEGVVRIERTADWLARQQGGAERSEPEPAVGHEGVEVVFGQAFSVSATVGEAEAEVELRGIEEAPVAEETPAAAEEAREELGTAEEAAAEEAREELGTAEETLAAAEESPAAGEELGAIEEAPAQPTGGAPEPAEQGTSLQQGEAAEPGAAPAVAAGSRPDEEATPSGGPAVGGAFRRVRLSELIEQLDQTLVRLRALQRRGALFLVEVATGREPLGIEEVEVTAVRLAEATRHTDLVLGVGSDMLAVVMELGPRAASLETIQERLRSASEAERGRERLRASVVSLDPEEPSNGEALVLAAVRQLGAR